MPIEELLAMYGYSQKQLINDKTEEGGASKNEVESHSRRAESSRSSSTRSRRRQKVVPLEPQRELVIPPEEAHESPPQDSEPAAVTPEQQEASQPPPHTATTVVSGVEGGAMATLEDPLADNEAVKMKTGAGVVETEVDSEKGVGLLGAAATAHRGAGLDETDEVDVEELDEAGMVKLSRDPAATVMLGAEQMERLGMDVVRMGDIEAGLKTEETLRLGATTLGGGAGDLGLCGISGLGQDGEGVVGGEEGEGLALRLEEEEDNEGEGERTGVEYESNAAVYEDVMLSSGNTREPSSESGGECGGLF